MQGVVIGTVEKSGESQYGAWALIAEPEVHTKSGGTFTPRVIVNATDIPPVGTTVMAIGTVMAKAEEYNGKSYTKLSLSFARVMLLGASNASAGDAKDASSDSETFGDDIPFHHLPYDALSTTRCGHMRW